MPKTNYWVKFEEEAIYHVYNRSINRERIFKKEENYYFFLRRFKELILPFFEIYAYCLLSNHFHFCISPKPISKKVLASVEKQNTIKSKRFLENELTYNDFLESQFKRLLSSYALAFNKQEKRNGSLFQKRFKRILITSEFRLQRLIAYIHHNPIHHYQSTDYHLWKFSSFKAFLSKNQKTSVAKTKVFRLFESKKLDGKMSFLEYHYMYRNNFELNNGFE